MKKQKILIAFSSDKIGGAERSLSRIAFESNSNNFEYRLGTLGCEGAWSDWIRKNGREPLIFGCKRFGFNTWLVSLARLLKYVKCNDVKIVYICGLRASLYIRFLRLFIPNVKLVHGVRWNPDSASKLDIAFRYIEKKFNFLVDAWIVNSEAARKTLIERCEIESSRVTLIYNGVDRVNIESPDVNKKSLEVLTIANISERKGYVEYLQTVVHVLKTFPDARFIFIGRDDMGGALQRAIMAAGLESNIEYVGFKEDVTSWLERARLFVLPSLWNEGCPTAILEAQAYGVPCIGFAVDGIPELIIHEEHGFVCEKGDYLGMAFSIERLLSDNKLWTEMSSNSLTHARNNFQLSAAAAAHEKLFMNIFGAGCCESIKSR